MRRRVRAMDDAASAGRPTVGTSGGGGIRGDRLATSPCCGVAKRRSRPDRRQGQRAWATEWTEDWGRLTYAG